MGKDKESKWKKGARVEIIYFFLFGREEEGKKKRIYKRKIDRRIERKERTQ